jgi:RimJ/RimL family protein N-acetyltransferase
MAIIRDVVEADIPIFFEQQRDPEARRMAVFPERERSEFTSHWQKILASDELTKKTILSGEEVAGNIVCFDRDGKRLVGYWLGREFWGQGLATRALAELLVEVTERPLYAYVAKTNIGSARVLEKCGFERMDQRIRREELGEVDEDLYVLNP